MNFHQAQRYLDSFTNYEIERSKVSPGTFQLSRIKKLLEAIGRPHEQLKIVHVAGTKGKGSTCAFTAYILREAGYRVGLYTSPHLHDVRERIRILEGKDDGTFAGCISPAAFAQNLQAIKPAIEKLKGLTYFEILTAMALYYFSRSKVDVVVLETGLGGRLDATNAVQSIVAAITPISLDHTQWLGKTLSQIAAEKAAIIKDRRQVAVIAPQEPVVRKFLNKHCAAHKVKSFFVNGTMKYNLAVPLAGKHQVINAATAIAIVEAFKDFGVSVSAAAIKRGIKHTRWPGRFEIVRKNPAVVLDCAHNPASAKSLVETVKTVFPGKKTVVVLGVSADKDVAGICRAFDKLGGEVILTKAAHPRAYVFKREDKKFFKRSKFSWAASLKEALRPSRAGKVTVVSGSIFTVAQARTLLRKSK